MPAAATTRVSVVIPVYNPGDYLHACLESVFAQDMDPDEIEVVAVDDGCTDGSEKLLDELAATHPNLRVIHQENSGWPGRPRNVGLGESRGRYVFFMDADDRIGPEAMRRLADFADAHDSDIVVPKMVGLGGRHVDDAVYRETQVDADLFTVLKTLVPAKLFRREFLDARGLRFPEGKVRLEDGMLLCRAYLTASRVSLAADYDYYFIRARADGGNISATLGDARDYIASVAALADIIREHARDPALAEAAVLDLYDRKALKHFLPERFTLHRPRRARAWMAAVGELARTRIPPELERRLPFDVRLRSRMVRNDDLRALAALISLQAEGREPEAKIRDGRIVLALRHKARESVDVTDDVALELGLELVRRRGSHVEVRGEVRLTGVRIERLPVALVVGGVEPQQEQLAIAVAPADRPWCWFEARASTRAAPARADGAHELSLRLDVPGATHVATHVATLPPEVALPPGARARVGAVRAIARWARHPRLTRGRRAAIRMVATNRVAARAYRVVKGWGTS